MLRTFAVLGLFVCISALGQPQRYVVSTYAGLEPQSDLNARFFSLGVAADRSGNIYFTSDAYCVCVFKLDRNGSLTRLAGGPEPGYSGDGGTATEALLNRPGSIAVDAVGNLYIADSGNKRVRKISVEGAITTVLDDGMVPDALAVDDAGNLFISQSFFLSPLGPRVLKLSPDGTVNTIAGGNGFTNSGDGGPATEAQLSNVTGLAADSAGNIFIASWNRIRKISPDGIIDTVAGGPLQPGVSDCRAGSGGDGIAATRVPLCIAYALAPDAKGSLFFTEFGFAGGEFTNVVLRKVSASGAISTVAADAIDLAWGNSMAVDGSGDIFITDGAAIRKISVDAVVTTVAGFGACCFSGDGGPAANAQFDLPHGLGIDNSGNLYVSDVYNHRIRRISPDGAIDTIAGSQFSLHCLERSGETGPARNAELCLPYNIAVDPAGNIYIADHYRVRKVSPGGTISSVAGNGVPGYSGDGGPAFEAHLTYASGVALDVDGNLYIRDMFRIRKVSPEGTVTTAVGNGTYGDSGDGGLAINAQITAGYASMSVDGAGNLYFIDNGRVRKVSPDGLITTAAIGGGNLTAVAADRDGNLFLALGSRLNRVSPDGTTRTISTAEDWDGGSLANVFVDGAGLIYIVTGNVVRVLRAD